MWGGDLNNIAVESQPFLGGSSIVVLGVCPIHRCGKRASMGDQKSQDPCKEPNECNTDTCQAIFLLEFCFGSTYFLKAL